MIDWLTANGAKAIYFLQTYNGAVTAFATFWIAVFTVVLAVVSRRQATLTRQSIDLANKEFVASHRPRIVLRDVHLEGRTVFYILANIGGTKATIVEGWILAEFVPKGTPLRPLRSAGNNNLKGYIFAGGEIKDLDYKLPGPISFAMMYPDSRRIGIEGKPPEFGNDYFTGTLIYADDLGTKRRSVFRRRWNGKSFERLTPEEERDHEYAD
ncbi:MAG: hypothetical protein WBF58_01330 [Xanthobacteraceae bacterium]